MALITKKNAMVTVVKGFDHHPDED